MFIGILRKIFRIRLQRWNMTSLLLISFQRGPIFNAGRVYFQRCNLIINPYGSFLMAYQTSASEIPFNPAYPLRGTLIYFTLW